MVDYKEFINSGKGVTVRHRFVTYRELTCVILAVLFTTAAAACCIALIVHHGINTVVMVNVTEVCSSHACLSMSAKFVAVMDSSQDPCDDFYKYACGKLAVPSGCFFSGVILIPPSYRWMVEL